MLNPVEKKKLILAEVWKEVFLKKEKNFTWELGLICSSLYLFVKEPGNSMNNTKYNLELRYKCHKNGKVGWYTYNRASFRLKRRDLNEATWY